MTTIENLNNMTEEKLKDTLTPCCGSSSWINLLIELRPYRDVTDLIEKSNFIWYNLAVEDWKEAFSAHPRIGDLEKLKDKYSQHDTWSKNEQKGVKRTDEAVLEELATKNDEYFDKFGFIFIVFATGKSAEEMLELLKNRLHNDPIEEINIAAREQNKITRLRLRKLLD